MWTVTRSPVSIASWTSGLSRYCQSMASKRCPSKLELAPLSSPPRSPTRHAQGAQEQNLNLLDGTKWTGQEWEVGCCRFIRKGRPFRIPQGNGALIAPLLCSILSSSNPARRAQVQSVLRKFRARYPAEFTPQTPARPPRRTTTATMQGSIAEDCTGCSCRTTCAIWLQNHRLSPSLAKQS